MFFELPHLTPNLRSSIKYHAQGGRVVLSFDKVERGHQAKYICNAVGGDGRRKKGKVDIVVLQRDKSNVAQDVGEEVGEGGKEGEEEDMIRNGGMVDKGQVKDWGEEVGLDREKVEGGVEVWREGRDEERVDEGMRGRVEQDRDQREVDKDVVTAAVPVPTFQTMEDRAKVNMLHDNACRDVCHTQ